MNISDSGLAQSSVQTDTSHSDSLSKPSGTIKDNASSNITDNIPSEIMELLINLIAGLVGGMRAQPVTGTAFTSSSGSNFILKFPELPSLTGGNQSSVGNNSKEAGTAKPLMNIPVLPSLMGSGVDGAKPVDSAQQPTKGDVTTATATGAIAGTTRATSGGASGTVFHVPPIPSLIGNSTALPSLSTSNTQPANTAASTGAAGNPAGANTNTTAGGAQSDTVFHVPPVPSLMGNHTGLPSVSSSPQVANTAPATDNTRTTRVNPLPSLVSPTTGSLSTPDLPKAFDPPAIPSLTGGSAELPVVSASGNNPSNVTPASATPQSDTVFHLPPIPSLLGNGTLDSLLTTLNSPSTGSTSSTASADTSNTSKGTGSHWK